MRITAMTRWQGFAAFAVVYALGVWTAAPAAEVAAPKVGTFDAKALIEKEFIAFDPDYLSHRAAFRQRLDDLGQRLVDAERGGHYLPCSEQIYLEAKWLQRYTAHWDRVEKALERLERSLDDANQEFATRQSPADGLWGVCYQQWFMRVGATVGALSDLRGTGELPRYRIQPPEQLGTHDKLLAYLQGLLVSEISRTGVDNRGELNSITTSVSQGLFKAYLRASLMETVDSVAAKDKYVNVIEAYEFFLRGWQDPKTGYWGAWYRVGDRIYKTADLSSTYHTISYRKGQVEHWPRIIATTSAIKSKPYPYGWLYRGGYTNHNNYDVAKIYRHGWPNMSEAQRETAREDIERMLAWTLAKTLRQDGTFKIDASFSDSLADAFYFGVSFLDVIGYWQPSRQFWAGSPVVEGDIALCCRIKGKLAELNLSGWAVHGAMERLERNCGAC